MHTVGVIADAENDFRGAVVSRDHVGSHHRGLVGVACQAEVQDLELALVVDHDVRGLEVLKV